MSAVSQFYSNKSIFITGGTGFMGKVLIEKLLRSCPDVQKIYMLIRQKRNKPPQERLNEFFNQPIFDKLKETHQMADILKKIACINGDVTQENMGISTEHFDLLKNKVQIVFHMAANVRFDQPLKTAVLMNTGGTKNVLETVKHFEKVVLFMHVSTSYCQCDREVLEEEMYQAPHDPKAVLNLVNLLNDETLKTITPHLTKNFPNTYAYTKCLTEHLVQEYSDKFKVVVVRPSIVTAAYKEPIPGWVDNLNGPTGILVGAGKGIIRSMHCNENLTADLVPVDITINRMIVIARDVGESKEEDHCKTQAFNITADTSNPVTWGQALEYGKLHFYNNPFSICLWYPGGSIKKSYLLHLLAVIFFHYIPAYFVDLIMPMVGQKRFLVNTQKRISTGLEVLQYYTTRPWVFKHEKIKQIEKELSDVDKDVFFSDMSELDWEDYLYRYVMGARRYCMKEGPETLPKARKLLKRMFYLHVAVKVGVFLLIVYFLQRLVLNVFM